MHAVVGLISAYCKVKRYTGIGKTYRVTDRVIGSCRGYVQLGLPSHVSVLWFRSTSSEENMHVDVQQVGQRLPGRPGQNKHKMTNH